MWESLWSVVESLAQDVSRLILVDSAAHRLHWVYLLTFFGIAAVLCIVRNPNGTRLLDYLLPKSVYGSRSFRTDIKVYLINGLLGGAINLGTIVVSTAVVAEALRDLLTVLTGETGLALTPNGPVLATFAVLFVLLGDLGIFLAHYAHHKIPFLWNFHKTHHSAEVLTPLTAFRFHPVELVLTGVVVALMIGPLIGLYQFLFDHLFFQAKPMLFVVITFAWLLTANFRHSHLPLHYPAVVCRWLVSPAMHNLHHSVKPAHYDKNLGFVFSFWDRAMKTYMVPDKSETFSFGIDGHEEKRFQSALACYLLPLGQSLALPWRKVRRLLTARPTRSKLSGR